MDFQTADLCDQFEERVRAGQIRVVHPMFNAYGKRPRFHGQIVTLKIFEDNSLVRQALERPGDGKVLVVDGGGSQRCALLGDQLAELGVRNRWAGVVVHGCIRDSAAIAQMDLGVRALGTHPLKSVKKGQGEQDVPVFFGGVRFHPGEFVYADEDGILVSPEALL